jgi:NitT/TauT family transport system ATP-binding protein
VNDTAAPVPSENPAAATPQPAARPALGLAVEGLCHGFGETPLFRNLSFGLPRGAVAALVGPSGAGKTTLLSLIGGLVKPEAGSVRHGFGRPAFVFQDPLLLPWRSARGNIAFALSGLKLDGQVRRERVRSVLVNVGLGSEDGGKYPHQLSGGMKKRVALARALAVEPDLLLLDEPFSGLDLGLARQMQTLVRRHIADHAVTAVIVTHDLGEAVRLADRIIVLGRGAPSAIAAVHDLARPARLRDDAYVEVALARLLARPEVRTAFSIDPLPIPRDGEATSGGAAGLLP